MHDIVSTSRRERKKVQCKYAILKAARECFQQNGYDETTVNQIAETADISYASFFNYFPTKESTLWAMEKEEFEDLYEMLSLRTVQTDSPLENIRQVMGQLIRDAFFNKRITVRLSVLRVTHAEEAHSHMELVQYLAGYFRQAQEQCEIAPAHDPEQQAIVLLGIMHASIIYNQTQAFCRQLTEQYLNSIRLL